MIFLISDSVTLDDQKTKKKHIYKHATPIDQGGDNQRQGRTQKGMKEKEKKTNKEGRKDVGDGPRLMQSQCSWQPRGQVGLQPPSIWPSCSGLPQATPIDQGGGQPETGPNTERHAREREKTNKEGGRRCG
jgi:hypothetical protein